MKNILLPSALLIACAVLTAGCAETRTEREFGDSVREVMSKQIHDPGAAALPKSEATTGGDPTRLEAVLEAHRGDVADPSSVAKPVDVKVRSNSR
jgi:hypothetical protein